MTLIVLFLIYFGLEALFYFFGPGHNVKYLVDNYDIKESFTNNQKDELSNYYFEISKDDFRIDLQIFDNFENEEKIITEIKSISDSNVQCILPIFKDSRILTDLLCLKDNVVYNYKTIYHFTIYNIITHITLIGYRDVLLMNRKSLKKKILLQKIMLNFLLKFLYLTNFFYCVHISKFR